MDTRTALLGLATTTSFLAGLFLHSNSAQAMKPHPLLQKTADEVAAKCSGKAEVSSPRGLFRSPNGPREVASWGTGPAAASKDSRHGKTSTDPKTGEKVVEAFDWKIVGGTCTYADQVAWAYEIGTKKYGVTTIGYGIASKNQAGSHVHSGFDHGGGMLINAMDWLKKATIQIDFSELKQVSRVMWALGGKSGQLVGKTLDMKSRTFLAAAGHTVKDRTMELATGSLALVRDVVEGPRGKGGKRKGYYKAHKPTEVMGGDIFGYMR